MKKRLFYASIMLLLLFVVGCNNVVIEDSSNSEIISQAYDFGKYSELGTLFKENLQQQVTTRTAVTANETNVVDFIVEKSAVPYLLVNNYISENAASYILDIESFIDASVGSLSEIFEKISQLELSALENLTGSDLDSVMNYAEISKASLQYWVINENAETSRKLFSWLSDKAKAAIISAAAGAVVGAVVGLGVSTVANIPVVGQVVGAVGGAVACAIESAQVGYETERIAVVFPFMQAGR